MPGTIPSLPQYREFRRAISHIASSPRREHAISRIASSHIVSSPRREYIVLHTTSSHMASSPRREHAISQIRKLSARTLQARLAASSHIASSHMASSPRCGHTVSSRELASSRARLGTTLLQPCELAASLHMGWAVSHLRARMLRARLSASSFYRELASSRAIWPCCELALERARFGSGISA